MGASLSTTSFSFNLSKEKIAKQWTKMVKEDLYAHGHQYSGSIGMLGPYISTWHDRAFKDEREARELIANIHNKWDPAIAVSYLNKRAKKWLVGGWCSS
jgi:hypothetical protein